MIFAGGRDRHRNQWMLTMFFDHFHTASSSKTTMVAAQIPDFMDQKY
ncbi:MAG: hypothetical protein PHN75_09565 [Syntrophales bacterium]|nr:hypothetical protein [Syntrophales bacterium]